MQTCVFVQTCALLCCMQLGDRIAMQYAGSGAHKKVSQICDARFACLNACDRHLHIRQVSKQDRGAGASAPAAGGGGGGGGKGAFPGGELTTSIKRYYSNSFRDQVGGCRSADPLSSVLTWCVNNR